MQNPKDILDPTTAFDMALALMAKAFTLNDTTLTNNNQRSSSNPNNMQIAQQSMNIDQDRQMLMVEDNVRNQFRPNAVQNVRNQVVQNAVQNLARAEGNSNGINGNPIRCYNFQGEDHYASNCIVKPQKQDAAYIQKQMQIAQKKEAGIQLTCEEFDFMDVVGAFEETERDNSNCTLENNVQEASTSGAQSDKASVYETDGSIELSKKKSTVSSPQEENKRLKSDYKIREDELLDKQIQLENKIKELDNILVKTGQSIQTMHMLPPKTDSFYHTQHKMAYGYQNLFYLKQAQQKVQSLYNGNVLLEKHDPPAMYDSEETLQLAQEKAAKFVRNFKSLAKEACESLAKHKALELEIDRLLRAVVSQDIMPIVQNPFNVNSSISKLILTVRKNDFKIVSLKRRMNMLNSGMIGTKSVKNANMAKFSMIKLIMTCNKRSNSCKLSWEIKMVKQSILGKSPSSGLKLYSVTPFPKSSILPKVDKTNALSKLVTSNSAPSIRELKGVQTVNVIAPRIFRTNTSKTSRVDNVFPNKPVKPSVRTKPTIVSQPHVITKNNVNSKPNGFSPKDIKSTTRTRRPLHRNNPKNDKIFMAIPQRPPNCGFLKSYKAVKVRFCIDSKSLNKVSVLVVLDLSKVANHLYSLRDKDLLKSKEPQVVAAAKLPILNPNKFDLIVDGVVQVIAPTNAEQRLAKKNEFKARGTLLMALPDKHQLKFNIHKDTKSLMKAIEKRFGGNKETKKVQKTLLKQQYEKFSDTSSESLDPIHDRLQKHISQLEILGETISQEDNNLKFLRSLPSELKTHTLIWRNKADLEDQSLNDLFNNLKIYEAEVKDSSTSSHNTQNSDFVSSNNTDNTNESVNVVPSVSAASSKATVSTLLNVDSLSDVVIYTFFASQSNSPQLDNEDLKQIDANDSEEIDLKWQMAMLIIRARRRGHFARECRSLRENRNKEAPRRTVPVEVSTSNALVSQYDAVGSYDWSFQNDEEPTNYALMAYASSGSSSSSGSDNESQFDVISYKIGLESVEARLVVYQQNQNVFEEDIKLLKLDVMLKDNALVELRKKFKKAKKERDELKLTVDKFHTSSKNLSKLLKSQVCDKTGLRYDSQVFNSQVFDCEELHSYVSDDSVPKSPGNDRYKTGEGYHAVPPPYTGTFMPPKPDLVFNDAPNANETVTNVVHVESSLNNPSKDMASVKTVEHPKQAKNLRADNQKSRGHKNRWNRKACFVCKSLNHLIKDCDYYEKQMVQKPVWNNAMRVNNQNSARITHPYSNRNVVPTTILTRPVKHAINKAHSPIRRPINQRPATKNSNFNKKVTTVKVHKVNVVQGAKGNAEKASANWGNPQQALKDKGVIDSGCSRQMTGNISFLSDFEEFNGGYVAFGGNPKGGKISGKGKIKTSKLDFDDVYFVNELKFNLFSVSQMVPRENNMYNVDLNNVVPLGDLTRLFAKATLDESNIWHRRLGASNIEPLVSLNLSVLSATHYKGIKREFSVARTPQQNGVIERKNRTLIDAARSMRADSLLPIPYWAKAINTAYYVLNMVLVTKPHNKTPYQLLLGRSPSIGFMRLIGCPVTILNSLDYLGKFDGKDDKGFLVGYSVNSKAFRVFNSRTRIVQEKLHINFLENKPNIVEIEPKWLFDIDTLSQSINYQPVVIGNQPNHNAENENEVHVSPSGSDKSKKHDDKAKRDDKGKSPVGSPTGVRDLIAEFVEFYSNITNKFNVASAPVTAAGPNPTNSTNSFNTASPFDTAVSPNFKTAGKSSFVDLSKYPDDPDMHELEDIVYSDGVGA
nr:hypothetical protein [Tanacetum cinerariifolium]